MEEVQGGGGGGGGDDDNDNDEARIYRSTSCI
jgi:hypothetical protein